ncbi:MAG: acyl-CoA dehydratase activase [Dehalococcoidia bacterium]|nr:acyl-CoA dehydratase activase [Dehalococcoidia bacterium]
MSLRDNTMPDYEQSRTAERGDLFMGIDVGSVSLNIAVIDERCRLLTSLYERTRGQPVPVLLEAFKKLADPFPCISGVVATGSGRDLIAHILDVAKENEIITQARAVGHFHPDTRTVIEIGGQDSKLIFLDFDKRKGTPVIVDHALNEICAAGTGSFLDQQAYRLGVSIDREFGELALRSERPSIVAGRCSVFAKSDMVHLQQEGTPKHDIVAGLCYALARNYISNLGKGRKFAKPIAFQGGVAANQGVVRAFEDLLELQPGELRIPEHFLIMGAIGSAIMALEKGKSSPMDMRQGIEYLKRHIALTAGESKQGYLKRLVWMGDGLKPAPNDIQSLERPKEKVYLGIDVGAASTNIVVLDINKRLLRKRYLMTEGEPIESVKKGLLDIARGIEGGVEVMGVGVTGSGRYFVGDFVGADVVVNEITAQSRATIEIDKTVDTIFEIGGQDSKYIALKNGSVVDFEMNKVCAAGTGSFLQEQAARLGIRIEEFSDQALAAMRPADLGTRCTVFMESDLIHHQQAGLPRAELIAGLSYSVAFNFIEKVVGNKKIGERIYFQGGVAANKSVAAAFENILGKPVTIPEHFNVTGAIGAALIARQRESQQPSKFVGFDLRGRTYQVQSFECPHCPNHCEVKRALIGGDLESFYGGICDRYEVRRGKEQLKDLPDLFKEREELLLGYCQEDQKGSASVTIGIPRMLMFYEHLPLWSTFFQELGFRVVISDRTNRKLINKGLQQVLAEMCYPVKVAYGHVQDLIEKGVDFVFLPSVIDLQKPADDCDRSYNCPYIQGIPFILKPAFEDQVSILSPTIHIAKGEKDIRQQMRKLGKEFGKNPRDTARAADLGLKAQREFYQKCQQRGREVLQSLSRENEAVVVIGKPYNVHDVGLNLNIPRKLRKMGVLAIPFDMLALDQVSLPLHYANLVWKNEQNLLRAAMLAREHRSLNPILITNYGCGPDAFFMKYLEDTMEGDPCLVLEVDEHSADAGIATRIEAFVDTVNRARAEVKPRDQEDLLLVGPSTRGMGILKPSRAIRELNKTFYLSYVGAHSHIFAAALESVGVEAKVLPQPDERSEELGRRYASSKECHPYQVTTGDLVRMTEMDGFDPDRSAFLMLNFDGSCRLTQYALSQKMVLKRLGLSRIPIIAPRTSSRLDEATRLFGLDWARMIWKGWLAADVLTKKLIHIRPYEVNRGETDRVYESATRQVAAAVVKGNFSQVYRNAVSEMDRIPIRKENRPVVGIVGEFYSCMAPWANNEIIREFESLGAEMRFGPTTTDYLVYFNEVYPDMHFADRRYATALYYYLRRYWHVHWQRKIEEGLGDDLFDCRIPTVKQRKERAAPYISSEIDPVATVNLDKAKGYASQGCSGMANLIVLNCLYGGLCTAAYKNIQREHHNFPVLTMIYDGLKHTNEKTRIEAFVYQVKAYQERHSL